MRPGAEALQRAVRAAEILAVAGPAVGGLWLRAAAGPAREGLLAALAAAVPLIRIGPQTGDEALYGGIDLAATLAARRPVRRAGLIGRGGIVVLTMAERCPPALAARLGLAIDEGRIAVLALDEGAATEEVPPAALTDRLGLFASLEGVAFDPAAPGISSGRIASARDGPAPDPATGAALRALTRAAAELGIASPRAVLAALQAARANAALEARRAVGEDDLRTAAVLTLAHRALPPEAAAAPPPEPPAPPESGPGEDRSDAPASGRSPDELLVEAARAALPAGLLAGLSAGRAARAARGAGGAGAVRAGNRLGRPLPSRPGRPSAARRIDLVATLRAAAPHQTLRRQGQTDPRPVLLRADDLRIRRHLETSDRLVVFVVDASGSSALARLGEAKGAVELLLGEAYVRRDHVALVAFRGAGAEVLLPPTRSLVQTKRRLASLPGGGGTPLAAGLAAGLALAAAARRRGMTPALAILSDGRANIALDGRPDRPAAEADALRLAARIRALGLRTVVIDTGNRPGPQMQHLAERLGAAAIPLPRADARRIGAAVAAAV